MMNRNILDTDDYFMTAWDIHTRQSVVNDQMPLLQDARHTIIEDKVIITPKSRLKQSCPVHIWDLSSNHVQEVSSFYNLSLYHLDATENVLVAFEIDWIGSMIFGLFAEPTITRL